MSAAFPTGRLGRLLALTILVALALIVWLGVVSPLAGFYRDRADALAQRGALADKMTEVAATLPRLKADTAKQANSADPPTLLLSGLSDALAEASLQDTLTKSATAAGVVLLSAEGAPATNVGAVRRIGLKINVSGKFSALVNFLARIDQLATPLLVDELQIQGLANQEGARTLVRLTVYGFRAGGSSS